MYQLNANIDTEREEEETEEVVASEPTKAKSRPKKYAIVRRTLAEKLEEMALRRELDIPNDIDPFK